LLKIVNNESVSGQSFETIYRDTFEAVSKNVYFQVAQAADAEDIVQEVYLRYYREVIVKGKVVENPKAYLMAIAANQLKRYYRFKARRPIQLNVDEQEVFENISDETDLNLEVINRFTVEEILQEIKSLSVLDQKILTGHLRFEMTFAELASSLALSENTVKTRYYRMLRTLRQHLDHE
jgi:RNA polymerase sigma-70 factor (ECF subfamily)